MKKRTFKSILLAFCVALLPLSASAATLGKLNVFSALGEPLNAEIELRSTPEELLSLTANIASDDIYIVQGVEKGPVQRNIRVSVVKRTDGVPVLWLMTSQPVTDPFLDMLIQVSWNDGKLTREYTLLLDPPDQIEANVDSPSIDVPKLQYSAEDSSSKIQADKVDSTIKLDKALVRSGLIKLNAKTKTAQLDGRKFTIVKGDTLVSIANRLKVQDVNLDQLLIGLYKANPLAFKNGNINRLIVGKVIDIPDSEALRVVNKENAHQEILAQVRSWKAYTAKLADEVTNSVGSDDATSNQNGGKIVTKAEENMTPETEGDHDVVKLAKTEPSSSNKSTTDSHEDQSTASLQDDLTAKRNDIKETDQKAAILANQIDDMKKLLAIKNKAMADAQQLQALTYKTRVLKKINPWVVAALIFSLLTLWWRAKRKTKINSIQLEDISNQITVKAKKAETEEMDVDNNNHSLVNSDAIEVSKVDLTGITLEFEAGSENGSLPSDVFLKPIPSTFDGDLSNLLKVEAKQNIVKATRKRAVAKTSTSDVGTKLELAVGYIDIADKKGALRLLKQVLKEGNADQRQRAEALIDSLA